MLKIQKNNFEIKYTEINIRQRMFEGKSFITLIINTEFYPSLINDVVISGSIEIKLDLEGIKSLDEICNKTYEGNIGNVTISVNNNGVWEHDSKDDFQIKINKRDGRHISLELETQNCKLKTKGTIVSLYTTSSTKSDLEKSFSLKEFYENPIVKQIGNSKISKYYIKM